MSDYFIPPGFNLPLVWMTDAATPAYLKLMHNVEEVIIREEDRLLLRTLRDDRLLFFSNHPTQVEPTIAWIVAQKMGARFNTMATRRAFDFGGGLVGKLFQNTGTFSVIPGIADRDSIAMARAVLAKPRGKLALYPEGEPMSSENDSLMPFQPGIVKIGWSALEDARKQAPAADITVLPAFVKYVVKASQDEIVADLERAIAVIAARLEEDPGERNLLRKFLMIGRILIERAESEYGIKPEPGADFDYRMGRIRHAALDGVADLLGVKHYNRDADAIQKLRHLTAVLELVELNHPQAGIAPSPAVLRRAIRECIRAYDFIVMKREYLVSRPTPERFYEWLARWESLILGKTPRALGGEPSRLPRKAFVFFAPPFHLGEYMEAYRQDRKGTLETILQRLFRDMKTMLDASASLTYTLVEPFDVGDGAG